MAETLKLKSVPRVENQESPYEQRIYGRNATEEEKAEALASPMYAECVKAMTMVEVLRFPKGRITPSGKQYAARLSIHDAVTVLGIVGWRRDS